MLELGFDESSFRGFTRVFPLPNHVMFPHVLQPLHVFEPRYRELVQDAIADDRLITLATLAPGWEQDYDGRPAVVPAACLCRLIAHHKQEDGRYNILLAGVKRVHLGREQPPLQAYRNFAAQLIHDEQVPETPQSVALHQSLLKHIRQLLVQDRETEKHLKDLLDDSAPLGFLTDVLAHVLDLDLIKKTALLAETCVMERAAVLLNVLESEPGEASADLPKSGDFPPRFSVN